MKFKKTIEIEMELIFPYYTKGSDTDSYYCILSEDKTIKLCTYTNSISTIRIAVGMEYDAIRESEFMDAFNQVMGNILNDLKR